MNERLKNFPISFFAIVMGLAGATLAWQRMEALQNWPGHFSPVLLWLTLTIFAALSFAYLAKVIRHFPEVKKEFRNTTKLAFFPTISISLLLMSIAMMDLYPDASRVLWIIGTPTHFLFSLVIITIWIRHPSLEINAISPAWFIPVVGNILVPIAGVAYGGSEISWFFFSIGLIFWLMLFTILLYRLIFHQPLPEKLLPTLFIMIAPPAVGCIAYVKLTGMVDPVARILYYAALFIFILLLFQVRMLSRIKYYLSWWAYTFPLAALTMATILMYHQLHLEFFRHLSVVFLILLTGIIVMLAVLTGRAIRHRQICIED